MSVISSIKRHLQQLGFGPDLVAEQVELWNGTGTADLVAHSRLPKDIRTAAIAVVDETLPSSAGPSGIRASGAALVFTLNGPNWRCSRLAAGSPALLGHGSTPDLEAFFRRHAQDFNPDAIYRAKAWGRIDPTQRQLDFVDNGLLPLMEAELGQVVSTLLEECIQDLAQQLGWQSLEDSSAGRRKAEWLVQAPFWLLAAKTLRDKNVERFRRMDLADFETVFTRLSRHYKSDDSDPLHVPKIRQRALTAVAAKIDRFASLELLSAEALGHVYESMLINKATRKLLGTHSTPPWLIDYVLGKLRPWIAAMPVEDRRVFEPACGHAGFLVGALRLLDELRPAGFIEPRVSYLRKRLHGVDIDPFSQEVARLALTLADVPNPNGWNLGLEDIFSSDVVERRTATANIVLANPPFENFRGDGGPGLLFNKAAETLSRIVHNLPVGGVLGFVGPQGLLQSKQAAGLRRRMLEEYEISEVTLFADEVFQYGEPESTVIIARKLTPADRSRARNISFKRIREGEIAAFAATLETDAVEKATAAELCGMDNHPLFVPDLAEVWNHLSGNHPPLSDWADAGQGFSRKGASSIPKDFKGIIEADESFEGATPSFANWDQAQQTHALPRVRFANLDSRIIESPRWGLANGIPQLLLNYARVSRGPWRLKCLLDSSGHPVTSRFIVVRPKRPDVSLQALWAILNSPLANAFAFSWLSKRDNIVGVLRGMPMPVVPVGRIKRLATMAERYLSAAQAWSDAQATAASPMPLFDGPAGALRRRSPPSAEELRILHLRLDAEVMSCYGLPPHLEKKILDLFDRGEQGARKGVPFQQCGYFPKTFTQLSTAAEYLAVVDWDASHADRKTNLIEKKVRKTATKEDLAELSELKRLSSARRDLLAPLPFAHARAVHDELSRETQLKQ